jgi:hypothetical protein
MTKPKYRGTNSPAAKEAWKLAHDIKAARKKERDNIISQIEEEVSKLTPEEIAAAAAELLARKGQKSIGSPNADFVLAHSEYAFRGDAPYMTGFVGTWRDLLEDLNGITDENRNELFRDAEGNLLEMKDMTDAQLVELFDEANGDGQPYVMVWSVKEGKKVLG